MRTESCLEPRSAQESGPDFSPVHNHLEDAVYQAVLEAAVHFPGIAGRHELMADVACVALNRLPPRYIRDPAAHARHSTDRERADSELAISEAVEFAFGFVQARTVMRARG